MALHQDQDLDRVLAFTCALIAAAPILRSSLDLPLDYLSIMPYSSMLFL